MRDAIERAFKLWSDVTPLTFREVFYEEADMEIRFASGYHEDGYRFDGPGMYLYSVHGDLLKSSLSVL